MPKRKEPELDPKEQYKRFKKAAKEAGVTNSEEDFERAFTRVTKTLGSRHGGPPKHEQAPRPRAGRPRQGGKQRAP